MQPDDSPDSLPPSPEQERLPMDGGGQTIQRGLGQSESNASILTAGSDCGPPARGPPQTARSVFRHAEGLQPHLKVNPAPATATSALPQSMQMVQAFPTLHRTENGQQPASSMTGPHRSQGHAQAMPMAAPMAAAASTARAPASASSMPRREAAPVWVIEEVIDFGLDANQGPDLEREIDDQAFRCNARHVQQHFRVGLFESCTTTMCADDDKDRC
uniref:Uncharacterized protein n=1 Tax=Alexandrium catenella TaxID=2925 RepID=A0A7S1MP05_ALECA|mmetsp:Transcript_3059/g.8266  ORF Transcript_3059/g.8266 Transcript_3059/m.8266 type:complete len:216 (+) Transcript_3059:38-685(+)